MSRDTKDNMTRIPRLQQLSNGASHLIVDGAPFLIRAGELHNSSLSSASYMSQVWANLRSIGLNTVLGSVSWEQIEPVEGSFDWTELDKVIKGAESYGLKLVLLWFGSFKNGELGRVPWKMLRLQECPYTLHLGLESTLRDFHEPRLQVETVVNFALKTYYHFFTMKPLLRTPKPLRV